MYFFVLSILRLSNKASVNLLASNETWLTDWFVAGQASQPLGPSLQLTYSICISKVVEKPIESSDICSAYWIPDDIVRRRLDSTVNPINNSFNAYYLFSVCLCTCARTCKCFQWNKTFHFHTGVVSGWQFLTKALEMIHHFITLDSLFMNVAVWIFKFKI